MTKGKPGRRQSRLPGAHRNESPAEYSWRVALQQSPLPLLLPGPFSYQVVFAAYEMAACGDLSPWLVSQNLTGCTELTPLSPFRRHPPERPTLPPRYACSRVIRAFHARERIPSPVIPASGFRLPGFLILPSASASLPPVGQASPQCRLVSPVSLTKSRKEAGSLKSVQFGFTTRSAKRRVA